MAIGDVFELVDVQTYQGQEVLNVYYYKNMVLDTSNRAQSICDGFESDILPSICAIQTPDLVHTELRCRNLYDVSEVHTSLISEPGTWVGVDDTPSFTAAGIRLVQDNGAIRAGAKRYAGIQEDTNNEGVFTDAGFITALVALGASLISGIGVGISVNVFVPIIIKRLLTGGRYVLPDNAGDEVYGLITDALYNLVVTSQTSRKQGRGA